MFLEENFAECLSKDIFQNMKRAGKTFCCPCLLTRPLFSQRTVQLGESSCKLNNLVDHK